ncbi:TPA: hypothetical protein U0398_001504 [Streptococcus suis]|nr:hypothetical protein [Streptococcus suis]
MPFLSLKTNQHLTDQVKIDLKTLFGQAIRTIPGKSEENLMVMFEAQSSIFLKGNEVPVALVKMDIFGVPQHQGYSDLAQAVTFTIHEVLDIPLENIYIDFYDIKSWSVAGYYMEDGYADT